jgi:uncharacterized membrane protein
MSTVIGIFDNPRDAQRGVAMLRDSRYRFEDISLISKASDNEVAVSGGEDVSAREGATVGALWGGMVGLASLIIPGVGPFIAGGALASALASAATGAVTGAVVGGIAAALIHIGGIPEAAAQEYESLVHAGKTLVAVKVQPDDMRHVRRILLKADAEEIRAPGAPAAMAPQSPVQVTMYDERGQTVDVSEGAD